MGKKVYAIKEGFDAENKKTIENIIVNTWSECLKYVKGVKGAKYKSFTSLDEANTYLKDSKKLLKKGMDEYPCECLHIYVDGSYNISTKRYAYGVVAVRDGVIEHIEGGSPMDTSASNIRQIAGELKAAVKAVEYALEKGDKKIVLFHDYEGIFHHATGSWERKDSSSEKYYDRMNELFKKGIEVIFVKVDSHTGDLYNELADEVCKKNLAIDSEKIVKKWLAKNKLYVADNSIKQEILSLAKGMEENIVIKVPHSANKNNDNQKLKTDNIVEELTKLVINLPINRQLEVLEYAKNISCQ